MGSCLSSEKPPQENHSASNEFATVDAAVSVSDRPDPPGLHSQPAGLLPDSQIAEKESAKAPDAVPTEDSIQQPAQRVPPVSAAVPAVLPAPAAPASFAIPPVRPKLMFGPPESHMSVYSDMVELEPVADHGMAALPADAQLLSATVTPAGNALMHLNRAAVLRNRMGPGGALPPMPAKSSPLASAEPVGSSSGLNGAAGRVLLSNQLPHPSALPSGAESFGSAFAANSNCYVGVDAGDSGVFDGPGSLVPTSATSSAPPTAGATASAAAGQGNTGPDFIGISSASGMSGTLGSAVSAFTSGASGTGSSGNFTAPLYGLGVEATLSEMQQMALIGSGGGGCVYIGRWRGVTVAIKFIVSSDDDQLTRSQREALLSRLASHPHVVQTYATSVTQLTEPMFKPKDGAAAGDALPGGLAAADPNISHDLLAGLTTGSWIRGEFQIAMHGGGSTANLAAGGGGGGAALPTIMETTHSSMGSASASMTTSGRGGAGALGDGAPPGSVSVNQTATYESDGQMSSSSTTAARGRAADAAVATASTLQPGQTEALACITTSVNLSCHTSATSSSVGGTQPQRLLHTALNGAPPPHAPGAQGASGSVPTSGSVVEAPVDGGQAGTNSGGGGSCRRCGASHGADAAPTGATAAATTAAAAGDAPAAVNQGGPAEAAAATAKAESTGAPGCGPAGAAAAAAGSRAAAAGNPGVADSFDASFVRDHLGRAKYSIHEVLRQLGAHETQFLTMVVMEYCDGGSLLAALKEGPFHRDTTSWSPRMWLRSTVRTALEIAHGMQHLHLSGLVHGDLKPGNVLLKGSNQDKRKFVAKVSDLGIAHPVGSADEMAIDDGRIGSIAYMAPEVFRGRMMKASDVYSFGVLLWQLACGTGAEPFEGAHPVAIALGVSEGKMMLRWPAGVFRPLQQLGELCLQTEPAARPSFKSVVGALEKLERHMQRLAAVAAAGAGPGNAAGSPAPPNVSFISPASSLTIPATQPAPNHGPAAGGPPTG